MTFVPVMWSVWGVLVLALLGLKIYSDSLARDEDDQIVLDEAFDNLKAEQAAIVARVHKVEPARKVVLGLVVAMTLVVIGYYVMDIVRQFQ
jgi:hypothetical protein